jgi:hypothetical protein
MVLRILRVCRNTLVERYRQPEDWVEVHDTGFTKKRKRWPFKPWERSYPWRDVREIYAYMLDCYCFPLLGFEFVCSDGKAVRVDEMTSGWTAFRDRVFERFPGFNEDNVRTVEGYAPGEGSLLCWRAASADDPIRGPEDGSV